MGYIGVLVAVLLFYALILGFCGVCAWRIWYKCGLAGWVGLIPIYNTIALAGVIGQLVPGIVSVICGFLVIVFTAIKLPILTFVVFIANFICSIFLDIGLSVHLGFPAWFAAVLLLCPIIGYPILAFANN